jgi:DNA-binding CsgD family transcriptional regulator
MKPLVRPLALKPVMSLSEGASAGERRERPAAPSPVGSPRLTARERECLLWAARGKTAWETSAILGIGEATVNNLLASAKLKLGAATRTHAVAKAITLGLIVPWKQLQAGT